MKLELTCCIIVSFNLAQLTMRGRRLTLMTWQLSHNNKDLK
jgi:hypothetical protein